ncbi:MAG: molybdopterin-dependent oxidoreductase [Verrucomicrobiota bacterium]
MDSPIPNRRQFLTQSVAALGAAVLGTQKVIAEDLVQLPFANGERKLVQFPQKRPLILLTHRPPQLETPFSVFNEGIITPNDAFFVRYHLSGIPLSINPETFRLSIKGLVEKPLSLSLEELRSGFENVEVIAVNQCSGNSRGFFKPRVGGGQLANGAMGNARWRGVRLKDLLERAGIQAGAKQLVVDGLDTPPTPKTPDFIKALELDHALDGEILLAFEMNGEPLPMLNGFPLRLVVPGYYGTYWIKHVHELTVVSDVFDGFYMNPAYRIPNTIGHCVEPGTTPKSTVPITRFNIRSFLTSLITGDQISSGKDTLLRGIAFDGGVGITEVLVSTDAGRTWKPAILGKDHGRYSFREWTLAWTPSQKGSVEIRCRAFNRLGESQPLEPLWNPSGYMRNVVESTEVTVA